MYVSMRGSRREREEESGRVKVKEGGEEERGRTC